MLQPNCLALETQAGKNVTEAEYTPQDKELLKSRLVPKSGKHHMVRSHGKDMNTSGISDCTYYHGHTIYISLLY